MKRFLKWLFWILAGLVSMGATLGAYLALTFDPNAYKPQIIEAVQAQTQRTLKLDGDIKLMFFPSIGVHLGKISLSEYKSEREFAAVEDASVSLAVWPLLRKQVVVSQVAVSGVTVAVVKRADGTTNLDDLLSKGASPAVAEDTPATQAAPITFDIAGVAVENCAFSYDDQGTGNQLRLERLSLRTGRLAPAVPTDVILATRIQMTQPKVDVGVEMAGKVRFDLDKAHYALSGLDLRVSGQALDIEGLKLKLKAGADADLTSQTFQLTDLLLDIQGKQAGTFDVHLALPGAMLKQEEISIENLALRANMDAAFGKLAATLSLPRVNGNLEKIALRGLAVDVGLEQPRQLLSARLETELIAGLKTQQFNLKDMQIRFKANGEQLPGKVIESTLKGSVQADLQRESIQANLAGGLLQSQIRAKAAVKGFKAPVIRYDLEVDNFDADAYLPPKNTEQQQAKTVTQEQPFDLSALKGLDVEGSVRIGALKAANVQVAKLRIDLKARDGIATIAPLSAALYQGNLDGRLRIDANTSSFDVTQKLVGVQIAPLLKDAAGLEIADGKGNVQLALHTQGNTVTALKRALNGKVAIDLTDGAIRGVDLGKLVQGIQRLNKDTKAETLGVNQSERTTFSEFKASLDIKDGVAHNDDLSVRSTVLRLAGNGDIDIGHDRMNYNAKVIMAKTEQGNTGTLPVNVQGPFDALKIKIDYAALFADIARQRLEEEKAALKHKLDDEKAAAQAAAQAKLEAEKAAAKAKLEAEKAAAKAKAEEQLKQGLKNLFK